MHEPGIRAEIGELSTPLFEVARPTGWRKRPCEQPHCSEAERRDGGLDWVRRLFGDDAAISLWSVPP